jgi:hypothetical protein
MAPSGVRWAEDEGYSLSRRERSNRTLDMASFGFWHRHTPRIGWAQMIDFYAGHDPANPAEPVYRGFLGEVVNARDRHAYKSCSISGWVASCVCS